MTQRDPLWRCPRCNRTFANRNQTHTCGLHDLESHFTGKSPDVRALDEFKGWLAEAYSVGEQRHVDA